MKSKILIADDEQEWIERLSSIFELEEEVEIVSAETIEAAMDKIIKDDDKEIKCIVCDSFKLDGWLRLFEFCNGIPFLIVTNELDVVKEICISYGVEVDILSKSDKKLSSLLKDKVKEISSGENILPIN